MSALARGPAEPLPAPSRWEGGMRAAPHALVVPLALALAVSSCGGSDRAAAREGEAAKTDTSAMTSTAARENEPAKRVVDEGGPLAKAELTWVRKYVDWVADTSTELAYVGEFNRYDENFELIEEGDKERLFAIAKHLAPLRECPEFFRFEVGDPPTTRLQPVMRDAEKACEKLAEGATAEAEAIDDDKPERFRDAARAFREAVRLISSANERLPQPGESIDLPRVGGTTTKSRVEPLFSRAASAVARRPVEVRCWSQAHWRKVLEEAAALTNEQVDENHPGFD